MKWEVEPWRKLYRREEGSFALLPLYARALAAELLKFVDDDGRIFVGNREPWEAIARVCGATAGDRRLLRQHIPMLIADGYLVHDGEHLRVRNMDAAQGRPRRRAERDPGTTPTRPDAEPATSDARTGNEPSTNRHEPETKTDPTSRKDSDPVLAGAGAPEERRSDPRREDPDHTHSAGAGGRARVGALPVAAVEPADSPTRRAVAAQFLPESDAAGWAVWEVLVRSEALRLAEALDGTAEPGSLARQAHGVSSKLASTALPQEVGVSVANDLVREYDGALVAQGAGFVPPTMAAVAAKAGRFFAAAQREHKSRSRAPPRSYARGASTLQPAAKPGEYDFMAEPERTY